MQRLICIVSHIIFVLCAYILCAEIACGKNHSSVTTLSNEADLMWAKYGNLQILGEPLEGLASVQEALQRYSGEIDQFLIWQHKLNRRHRDKGIEFWERFPEDPRRFQWLLLTLGTHMRYWQDEVMAVGMQLAHKPELRINDELQTTEWNRHYVSMRAEFLQSSEVSKNEKLRLRCLELSDRIDDASCSQARGEKWDLMPLINELLEISAVYHGGAGASAPTLLTDKLIQTIEKSRQLKLIESLLTAMERNSSSALQLFATGKLQEYRLRSNPLKMNMRTFSGEEQSLDQYRGKVVLVYIWSNSCPVCIENIPAIQRAYERYKTEGFEVVGVWQGGYDTDKLEAEKALAIKILSNHGVKWTNGILNGKEQKAFHEKYSIIYMPVAWLLDEQGKLVSLLNTDDIRGDRLVADICRLLRKT